MRPQSANPLLRGPVRTRRLWWDAQHWAGEYPNHPFSPASKEDFIDLAGTHPSVPTHHNHVNSPFLGLERYRLKGNPHCYSLLHDCAIFVVLGQKGLQFLFGLQAESPGDAVLRLSIELGNLLYISFVYYMEEFNGGRKALCNKFSILKG